MMDKKDIQVIDLTGAFDMGKRLVEFAQENPFTIILLGVGVLLDKALKSYQENNKEEK